MWASRAAAIAIRLIVGEPSVQLPRVSASAAGQCFVAGTLVVLGDDAIAITAGAGIDDATAGDWDWRLLAAAGGAIAIGLGGWYIIERRRRRRDDQGLEAAAVDAALGEDPAGGLLRPGDATHRPELRWDRPADDPGDVREPQGAGVGFAGPFIRGTGAALARAVAPARGGVAWIVPGAERPAHRLEVRMETRRGVAKWPAAEGRTASGGARWLAAWAALAGALTMAAALVPRGGHAAGTASQARADRTVADSRAQTPVTRAIERVALGDRVAGRNPLRDQVEPGPEPDPASWRRVDLRMAEPGGGALDVGLLRPLAWVQAAGATPGATVALDLPELGAAGAAAVVAVGPCPPIAPGPGRVVTGTFAHSSAAVLDLRLEGQPEPIGVTAGHPFYSEERGAFVPAGQLRPGERLRGRAGPQQVASVSVQPGRHRVYNLEVHGEHVYCVTDLGIIVHNSCDTLYRVIRAEENPLQGLTAKNPAADYSAAAHVANGSRISTQYISTTKSLAVALKHARRDGLRIVQIDGSKLVS